MSFFAKIKSVLGNKPSTADDAVTANDEGASSAVSDAAAAARTFVVGADSVVSAEITTKAQVLVSAAATPVMQQAPVIDHPPVARAPAVAISPAPPVMRSAPPAPPTKPKVAAAPPSPLALQGSPQTQADWLTQQIGKTAKFFVQTAQRNNWSSGHDGTRVLLRSDVSALMLGYKLVSATYQLHNHPPGMEVMRLLRAAITVPLHRAMQAQAESDGTARIREVDEHLKAASLEISETLRSLRGKEASPFAAFYPSLAASFGGAPEELETRYAATLRESVSRLEQAMASK